MSTFLSVTAIHALPGRLRLRLSVLIRNETAFLSAIREHEGITSLEYSPVSRGMLIHYQTGHLTTEEVLLRAALALSMDHDNRPVCILRGVGHDIMTDGAAISGLFIGVVALLKWSGRVSTTPMLEKMAAWWVGGAVLQHGWREVREQGHYDPELLSLAYLVGAAFYGRWLRGAAITWATCFGRHLFSSENSCVEVRPLKQGGETRYEVVVAPGKSQHAPLFGLAQALIQYLASGGVDHGTLFEELRNVSRAHGEVLEGLGPLRHGIPLTFK